MWAAWVLAVPVINKALALDDATSSILQYGPLQEPLQRAHEYLQQWARELPVSRTELHSALKVPVKQKLPHAGPG